jgi:preprotein translocase subunit SecY
MQRYIAEAALMAAESVERVIRSRVIFTLVFIFLFGGTMLCIWILAEASAR